MLVMVPAEAAANSMYDDVGADATKQRFVWIDKRAFDLNKNEISSATHSPF